MSQVFDLLFICFEKIVAVMKSIEIFDGVNLLTFSIAIVIMSMYFDFVFDIFTDLSSLSILIPLVAVVALYGVVRLCLSLYRSVEK